MLDVGCGIGRNLLHFPTQGVGVDTNEECVRAARARGLTAFTPGEFRRSSGVQPAGAIRLDPARARRRTHEARIRSSRSSRSMQPLLRPGGQLILITPQEAGFRSDATHVEFMDFPRLTRIAERLGFVPERAFSFPFPRWAGRLFTYNEFVVVSRKPAGAAGITVNE